MANRGVRRLVFTGTAVAVVAASLTVSAVSAETADDGPRVPELRWTRCHVVYECTTARVPLDYDSPQGPTIELALIRRPADDPDHRIGSLFVHPGGPGNAVTDPLFFAPLVSGLGGKVRARFDIVGVDPRGTGGSSPVTCKPAPDTDPVPAPSDTYPSSDEQYDRRFAYDDYLRKSCAATAGPILDHLSTADTARDLDLMRRAVGDERLSFYGLSYGAILGQTYAALYPDRVRAIAVDGVFDPERWATGELPPFARTESGQGTAEAVDSALDRCDDAGVLRCALAGNARERWHRLRESLARKPIEFAGVRMNDKTLVDLTEAAVQLDHISGVPVSTIGPWLNAVRLIELAQSGRARALPDSVAPLVSRLDRAADTAVGAPARLGPWCADTENPADRRTWIEAGLDADAAAPGFGPSHSWATSACANWPGSAADAYRGPFDVTTSTPLLTIGLTHDSTTPIAGAYSAAARFPGSRVVEVESWGHTALGKSNRCLRPLTDAYLLEQRLPARNRVCAPDHGLF